MLTIGLLIGMAVSIMPGLGLVMGIVLTLPFTYTMEIEPSIILSLAGPFAKFALTFDSPDYFAIIVLGLATVVCLATTSLAHAFVSLFFGLILATVGIDTTYGAERFTFGGSLLSGGINYVT